MNILIRNFSILLFAGLFAISCASTESATSTSGTQSAQSDRSSGSNGYSSIITSEAETQEGVVDVHTVGDKIYYEIPDSLLGRDFLMVSRVASVPSNFSG